MPTGATGVRVITEFDPLPLLGRVELAWSRAGAAARRVAEAKAKGRMRRGVVGATTALNTVIGDTDPAAIFVEKGTSPHEIEPKQARVLRFSAGGGGVSFAQHVQHPGEKAQPFLRPAMDAFFELFAVEARTALI